MSEKQTTATRLWAFAGLLLVISCEGKVVRPELFLLEQDVPFESLPVDPTVWRAGGQEIPNLGFRTTPLWVRFHLVNEDAKLSDTIVELGAPWMDLVDFYVSRSVTTEHYASGSLRAFTGYPVFHRNPSLSVRLDPGEAVDVYIRAKTTGVLFLPLRLWNAQEFIKKAQAEYAIHGLYFGLLICLLIYNFVLFLYSRESSYLYYWIYLFAVLGYYLILTGIARQFFFPLAIQVSKEGILISSALGLCALCLFNRTFLHLWTVNTILDRSLLAVAAICGVCIPLAFVLPYFVLIRALNVIGPLVAALLFGNSLFCFIRRVDQSKYFLVAWTSLILGMVIEVLTNAAVLPVTLPGRFGIQIGTLIEIVVFSFVLGRRMKVLTSEKAIAQASLSLLERDLDFARDIQRRILPSHLPALPGATFQVKYVPLYAVGGDFYDFHIQDSHHAGILIADVTGHGVSAALDSSTVKIAFGNEKANASSPSSVLANMNRFLVGNVDYRFVSAFYAYLDLEGMVLSFASAGHPPALLLREGAITALEGDGTLLGLDHDSEYGVHSCMLKNGDRLVFYTDGIHEGIAGDGSDLEVLIEQVRKHCNGKMVSITDDLVYAIKKIRGSDSADDLTLLVLEIAR